MKRSRPNTDFAIEIDEQLAQADHVKALQNYHGNWIRSTRHALGWTLGDLAERSAISKQAVSLLEARERDGTISIRKLEELAKNMSCRFVYGFIPDQPMATTAADLDCRQREARRLHRTMPRPC